MTKIAHELPAIAFLGALGALLGLGACTSELVPEPFDQPRVGPRPAADDIGVRRFAPEASLQRAICPLGVGCTTADVNRDGKDDLVRFDSFGIFGTPGTVEVAYSNGWDFGPMRTVADGVCIDESGCTIADVDGDGVPDLIRFIRDEGANGVEVYPGVVGTLDHELLFTSPVPWIDGLCALGELCAAADVTGDGTADLVSFVGGQYGEVLVSVSDGAGSPNPVAWVDGVCADEDAECRLGDVDGDGRADVVELHREAGTMRVALALPTGGFGPAQPWGNDLLCPEGATCLVGDFDGDFDADVVSIVPPLVALDPMSCSGSCGTQAPEGCACDVGCTARGDCCADYQSICEEGSTCAGSCGGAAGSCMCDEACEANGDCCSDYEPRCSAQSPLATIHIWPSLGDHFGPLLTLLHPGCWSGAGCWTADVTGDGRVDLLSIGDSGTLTMWPSEDTLDRLDRNAMRLSMLRADWERRRAVQARREMDALLLEAVPLPPWMMALPRYAGMSAGAPPPPTPSDPAPPSDPLPGLEPWPLRSPGAVDRSWFQAEDAARVEAIEEGIMQVLDALPTEDDLLWTADQLRWQVALGKVIAARTALYSPALGVSAKSHGGACQSAVLYDRMTEESLDRHEGSYVTRYYDGLRIVDLDDRLWASLPALTGVVEGMRCLSERELAALEEAYVRAVLTTMSDLLERNHAPLAHVVWDQALPIELLLYDGVKSFTMPAGWSMLQVVIEGGLLHVPERPAPGTDFDTFIAADSTTCDTVRCRLYKSPARDVIGARNLTLDTLGVWLPDLTARDRLRRSLLNPRTLLDIMVNVEMLGEGDCPLIEVGLHALSCKSRRTCQFSTELAEMASLGLQVLPGNPASAFTHFGTARADLPTTNGCGEAGGGGGGAPPSTCTGPQLRGHRGRFFPLDPELDALMTCTLEVFEAETPTEIVVDSDLSFDPACLVSNDPQPDPSKLRTEHISDSMDAVADLLVENEGAGREYGHDREAIISVIMSKTGASHADVLAAMQVVGSQGFVHAWPQVFDGAGGQRAGMSSSMDGMGNMEYGLYLDREGINADLEAITDGMDETHANAVAAEYMFDTMLHEAVHMVVTTLMFHGLAPNDIQEVEHEITDALGLGRSCDVDSANCSAGCGYTDARMARFSECLEGETPALPDRCEFVEDYCADRHNGNLDWEAELGCDAPAPPALPPICAAVLCSEGSGSSLAAECCDLGAGTGEDPPQYLPTSPGPGPYPGDPDGPLPPVPGGPGGPGIPPIPPVPGL